MCTDTVTRRLVSAGESLHQVPTMIRPVCTVLLQTYTYAIRPMREHNMLNGGGDTMTSDRNGLMLTG